MLGWPEIVGILIIVLVLFGAKKVPELMRGLGSGLKEFKKATRDVQDELQAAIEDEPSQRRTRTETTPTVARTETTGEAPEAQAHPTHPTPERPA